MKKIINVRFNQNSPQTYAYYTTDDTIKAGDFVAVMSPNGTQGPDIKVKTGDTIGYLKIVEVESVKETVSGIEKVQKSIICKIELATYFEELAKEEEKKILIAKIEKAKKEALAKIEMEKLVSMSPELAELIKNLNALNN